MYVHVYIHVYMYILTMGAQAPKAFPGQATEDCHTVYSNEAPLHKWAAKSSYKLYSHKQHFQIGNLTSLY